MPSKLPLSVPPTATRLSKRQNFLGVETTKVSVRWQKEREKGTIRDTGDFGSQHVVSSKFCVQKGVIRPRTAVALPQVFADPMVRQAAALEALGLTGRGATSPKTSGVGAI